MDRLPEATQLMVRLESLAIGGKLKRRMDTSMQQDYLAAFLLLSQPAPDLERAQVILARHSNHKHPVWAEKWACMAAYVQKVLSKGQSLGKEAATPYQEDFLTLDTSQISSGKILVLTNPAKSRQVQVGLHKIDVEMVFSNDPFSSGMQGIASATFVQPALSKDIPLATGGSTELHLSTLFPGTCCQPICALW
jgi:hypothetical protein